jgi:hypothetical protein
MINIAIAAGVVALVGLLVLFGWYDHKLET